MITVVLDRMIDQRVLYIINFSDFIPDVPATNGIKVLVSEWNFHKIIHQSHHLCTDFSKYFSSVWPIHIYSQYFFIISFQKYFPIIYQIKFPIIAQILEMIMRYIKFKTLLCPKNHHTSSKILVQGKNHHKTGKASIRLLKNAMR